MYVFDSMPITQSCAYFCLLFFISDNCSKIFHSCIKGCKGKINALRKLTISDCKQWNTTGLFSGAKKEDKEFASAHK